MKWCKFHTNAFKKCVSLLFLNLFIVALFAQKESSLDLTGTITDSNGKALSGVSVTIQESTVNAVSSKLGKYSIFAVSGDILTFSLPGFKTISKTVGKDEKVLDVVMAELKFGDTEQDVVPVPFSSKNKRFLTSAISMASYEDFSKRKDINTMNNLGGLVNGLIEMSTGWSDTGLGTTFYVRGLKTTNPNNAPLILVDDVERTFGELNVGEIESISVLKDASALAIYGNKGANGAILIRTKRGKINKREVTINAQMGMSQFQRMPQMLNSYDYARLYNVAQTLDGKSTSELQYSDDALKGYKLSVEGAADANPYKYPNVDFYQKFLKPVVKQQQHDLTMTGGTDVARYFVFLGFMNQEGAYKYGDNSFYRINFRSNADVSLNKNLVASMNMSGRIENQKTPGGHYAWELFSQFATTPSNAYPIFNENGTLGGNAEHKDNPYGKMVRSGYRDQVNRFFNADVQLKLNLSDVLKGLSWSGKGGIDFSDGYVSQLTGDYATYQLLSDGTYTDNGTSDKQLTTNFWFPGKDRQFSLLSTLNYDRKWKSQRLNALALFYLRELNTSGIAVPYKNVGFAAQASYAIKERYLLDGTLNYSGSENFARGHRFGFFPAVSAGWIVSEEGFLRGNDVLSFLKVRASYGATGLDRPFNDRFLFRENWSSTGGYAFGVSPTDVAGVDMVRSGNDNLKWETSIKKNIGLDFGFNRNTIRWTVDGFIDDRKDILVQKYNSTLSMAGIPLPYENFGSTRGWGFDTELAFDKQITKDFHLTVKSNFMLTRSKIINIDESYKKYAYQYMTGNPIGQPFGYVSNGFFTQEEIDRRAQGGDFTEEEKQKGYDVLQNGGNIHAGDIKYVDSNGDNIINWDDAKAIAKNSVPQMIAGLSVLAQYKGFDFAAQVEGMGDRYIYMPGVYSNSFDGGGNASVYALKAWTPETAATAIYPRLSIANNSNNHQYSDFWFRDGSFIKLKTIEFGYSFPTKLVKSIGLSKIRTYVNGYNLLCLDYVKDFDPEDTNAGIYVYPFQRILTVGINISL